MAREGAAGGALPARANVIPTFKYRDAPAAIEWLCAAFGFRRRLVVPGEQQGVVLHSQLEFGNGMVMVSSAERPSRRGPQRDFDRLVRTPADVGGVGTHCPYVVVDDPAAHHARAVAAGAEVLLPLEDQPHGGSAYTCRDPEGHVWTFGSYDPFAEAGEA